MQVNVSSIVNVSISLMDGTLTGITSPGQSEPGINGNERYRTEASPSDAV